MSDTKLEKVAILRSKRGDVDKALTGLRVAGLGPDNDAVILFTAQIDELDDQISNALRGMAGEASRVAVAALLSHHGTDHWNAEGAFDTDRKIKLEDIGMEYLTLKAEETTLAIVRTMIWDLSKSIDEAGIPVTSATVRIKIVDGVGTVEAATRPRRANGVRSTTGKTFEVFRTSKTPTLAGWLPFPPIPEDGITIGDAALWVDAMVSEGHVLTVEEHAKRRYKNGTDASGGFRSVNWRKELITKYGIDFSDIDGGRAPATE